MRKHDRNNITFIGNFENKVKETIRKYNLCEKKEKILVALSGGKDSTTTAYLLKKLGYNISCLHINLHIGGKGGYSNRCLKKAKQFCSQNNIKLCVYDIKKEFGSSICYIRSRVQLKHRIKNCLVCGVIKKWILNKKARQLKADKIATGHNLDDEAQTVLMNFLKGNPYLSINSGPATGITQDKKFVQRIKPLFFTPENEIKKYSLERKLPVIYEKCPCAIDSLRIKTRKFLDRFDNEIKMKILENFLELLPVLKKNIKIGQLKYCKICEEPSRNEICKKCKLLQVETS